MKEKIQICLHSLQRVIHLVVHTLSMLVATSISKHVDQMSKSKKMFLF